MGFVDISIPQKGDILRAKRKKGYAHFGIAISCDRVIHFTGSSDDSCFDPDNVAIRETSLELFKSGDQLQTIEKYDSPFTRDEVVARAKQFNNSKTFFNKKYNFMTNNCEHFARWAYYDEKRSLQFESGLLSAIGATIAIASVTGLIVKKVNNNKK